MTVRIIIALLHLNAVINIYCTKSKIITAVCRRWAKQTAYV